MKLALRSFLILAGASLALLVGNPWPVSPETDAKGLPMALAGHPAGHAVSNAPPFHASWERLFPATGWQ